MQPVNHGQMHKDPENHWKPINMLDTPHLSFTNPSYEFD